MTHSLVILHFIPYSLGVEPVVTHQTSWLGSRQVYAVCDKTKLVGNPDLLLIHQPPHVITGKHEEHKQTDRGLCGFCCAVSHNLSEKGSYL
jgi:hypothetical protein